MRELVCNEVCEVSGGLDFTSPVTMKVLGNVGDFGNVARYLTASFSAGYFVGTYLNERYSLSMRIVDLIT